MKNFKLALLPLLTIVTAVLSNGVGATDAAPRVIEIRSEKIGETVHWVPEKIEVNPGENLRFVVKHELVGGFDFHGFSIRELDIVKQVDRNKTMTIDKVVPLTLAPGEYKLSCQFHPKHMPASLIIVKAATPAPSASAPATTPKKSR